MSSQSFNLVCILFSTIAQLQKTQTTKLSYASKIFPMKGIQHPILRVHPQMVPSTTYPSKQQQEQQRTKNLMIQKQGTDMIATGTRQSRRT